MNAFAMLRQAPAKPAAPIVPQYSVEDFTADGVVVQVFVGDKATEFLVDWDADRDGATMATTCTITHFNERGEIAFSSEGMPTPDWIQIVIPAEVEAYLTRCAQEYREDLCCEPDFF